jgi:predicted NBD/HSP70 family sugar kinase
MTKSYGARVSALSKKAIACFIKDNGMVSRADIARGLHLSKPAVSDNVEVLILNGIVTECGAGSNPLGKKSVLLTYNNQRRYLCGIDIGNFVIRVGIADLSGKISGYAEEMINESRQGMVLLDKTLKLMQRILRENNIKKEQLAGICAGIPGIIDRSSGRNILSPFIEGWKDIDLSSFFYKHFKTQITIENNVNMGAIGELSALKEHNQKDAVYINFGIGISCGIIINNTLIKGKDGCAGEIGYITLNGNVRQRFNDSGEFEHLVSTRFIIERYNAISDKRIKNNKTGINTLLGRYQKGEDQAVRIMQPVLNAISVLLVNITAMLNPEVIIFGGGFGERLVDFFDFFETALKSNVPFVPQLVKARHGALSGVHGAIHAGLDALPDNLLYGI